MDSLIITRGGKELVSRLIDGSTTVKFTKIRTSDHDYSAISDLTGISELESIKQEVPISKITRVDDTTVVVRALMDNKDLSEGYYVRTAGLYAKDGEENEILFGISVADEADHMPAYGNSRPSGIIFTMNVLVDNAKQVVLNIDPTGAATIQDIMDIESPEFDDSGTVEGISSFPSFLETMKSKMNFFQFFRNLKAGLQFVLHAGQIVNNCVTDNAGLPLSAAQGKALMDKYTQLYSEVGTVSDNLSKAISCSDLFADYSAPTFVEWNGNTLNTPFKAGFTDCQEGFAFCYGNRNNYMTVIAFAKNSNKMWAWSKAVNAWIEYVTKSDLEPVRSKQINRYVSAENNTDTVLSSYENKEGNFILQFTSNNTTGAIPTLTGSRLFIIEHFMVGNNSDSAIERAYSTKGKLIAWRFKQWWDKTWTAWENS